VEQELTRLEHEWSDAVVKRDTARLDRLLVGEVVLGTAEGKWLTKAEYLAEIKSGEWVSTSEVVDNTSVRVYGDMAVITGRTTSTSQYHGVDSSGQYLWSDTWTKRDGRWQCVASHGSKVPAAPSGSAGAEQELIRLEDGWNEAVVKVDLAFLDRILADDLTDTDDEGTVWTKAQDLANLKSGDYKCTSAVSADRQVRVYGDTAVVTGRNTNKAQYKGVDKSGQYRWTDTWIKRDGRWQCVATHGSKIVPK